MFFTKKSIVTLLFLGTFGIAIYYFNFINKPTSIEGEVLALVVVDSSNQRPQLNHTWNDQNITLEWIDKCDNIQSKNNQPCFKKILETAIKRAKFFEKPLIIIAEKEQSAGVLSVVNNQYEDELTAIILLQPNISIQQDESVKLSSKVAIIHDLNDSRIDISRSNILSASIRDRGHWVWFTMLDNSSNRLITHPVLPYIISFINEPTTNVPFYLEFDAESRWQQPIFNNAEFFDRKEFIEERRVDTDIKRILKAFYAHEPRLLKQWPLETYKAFDLLKYRDSLPSSQQGRYVSFKNRKGHQFYLDLDIFAEYEPKFVISIDDEDNLYRLTSFYITKRYYSWREGGPKNDELYSQSMGAFIHFKRPLPSKIELPYLQYSSILMETIKFSNDNPYESLEGLSDEAFRVVTLNCIPCHKVNGVGGAAFHLDYLTGESKPGFAKPVLSYSQDVLNNFFFNQTATAKLIGVNPNYVDLEVGHELFEWIQSKQ